MRRAPCARRAVRSPGAKSGILEDAMLNHELRRDDAILVLKPDGPPAAAGFKTLTNHVDGYLEQHGTLRGLVIHEKALRGWNDFSALVAQLQFIKRQYRQIEKVAVLADGGFATLMPFVANHFIDAQVKHFDHAQDERAVWDWLTGGKRRQLRAAA
jgi:hypothetical protein